MKQPIVVFAALLVLVSASEVLAGAKKNPLAVKRGEYLVNIALCDDCHSPKNFTQMGPVPDATRRLSGHPAEEKVTEVPMEYLSPERWGAVGNNHFTAWAGPWGINLTPDMATGLGSWTEEMFIKTLRTGKHMGEGRDILPPMPWPQISMMTDDDLKAVFAFLQSLAPIENPVPEPIPLSAVPTFKKASH